MANQKLTATYPAIDNASIVYYIVLWLDIRIDHYSTITILVSSTVERPTTGTYPFLEGNSIQIYVRVSKVG